MVIPKTSALAREAYSFHINYEKRAYNWFFRFERHGAVRDTIQKRAAGACNAWDCSADESSGAGLACGVRVKRFRRPGSPRHGAVRDTIQKRAAGACNAWDCSADESNGAGLACGVRVKRSVAQEVRGAGRCAIRYRRELRAGNEWDCYADESNGAGLAFGVRVKRCRRPGSPAARA